VSRASLTPRRAGYHGTAGYGEWGVKAVGGSVARQGWEEASNWLNVKSTERLPLRPTIRLVYLADRQHKRNNDGLSPMFRKPTTFILGAGASWHYNYPTGENLVREVIQRCEIAERYFFESQEDELGFMPKYVLDKLNLIPEGGSLSRENAWAYAWHQAYVDASHLKERLRSVDPLVIDYFLGHNDDLQRLGKMMIAWVIRERETEWHQSGDNLNRTRENIPRGADNWLRFLVHRLVVGCSKSTDLFENNVSFVTLNYDMSLEDVLGRALHSNSLFGYQDVEMFLKEGRIVHAYGSIRDVSNPDFVHLLPLVDEKGRYDQSGAQRFFNELDAVTSRIRTIDPHDKSDEVSLKAARGFVDRARCIYILGFGFDRQNCERIGLVPASLQVPSGQKPRSILFTNFQDSNRVNKAASKMFMGNSDAFVHKLPNVDHRGTGGNYHEKSIRNCYDALALDFDEFEEE
jgi:hypothetical protein